MKKRLACSQFQVPQFLPENNVRPTRRRSATNPRQFSKSWLEAVKLSPFNMMASYGGNNGNNDNSRSEKCCNHGLYIKPNKTSASNHSGKTDLGDEVGLFAGIFWDVSKGYVCTDGDEDYWSYLDVAVTVGSLIAPAAELPFWSTCVDTRSWQSTYPSGYYYLIQRRFRVCMSHNQRGEMYAVVCPRGNWSAADGSSNGTAPLAPTVAASNQVYHGKKSVSVNFGVTAYFGGGTSNPSASTATDPLYLTGRWCAV